MTFKMTLKHCNDTYDDYSGYESFVVGYHLEIMADARWRRNRIPTSVF